jgi:ABC-2 type transport system permease protein
METSIPKTLDSLKSLLRADFTTQWRNRRAVMLTLIVPLVILVSWKGLVAVIGGQFVLANSITIGLFASGLLGYSNAIARDRDKGIFQRLRVAPIPSWAIMASRLIVQLAMILIITTLVFVIGNSYDKIALTPVAYIFTYGTAITGGLVSLSLGQMIVGSVKNPETVNSTTRLVYLSFIVIGMFGQFGDTSKLGEAVHELTVWSPYGTVKTILSASMEPAKWNNDTSMALLATLVYSLVFSVLGIKWFKWNTK